MCQFWSSSAPAPARRISMFAAHFGEYDLSIALTRLDLQAMYLFMFATSTSFLRGNVSLNC